MTLNQKQLKNLVEIAATAGRLSELNRLEGYVPSATISRRRSILKKQLSSLLGKEEKEEEQTVNIKIEVNGEDQKVEKKEKSYKFNLKDVLSGKFGKDDDDDDDEDDILKTIKGLFPREAKTVLGHVVTEL